MTSSAATHQQVTKFYETYKQEISSISNELEFYSAASYEEFCGIVSAWLSTKSLTLGQKTEAIQILLNTALREFPGFVEPLVKCTLYLIDVLSKGAVDEDDVAPVLKKFAYMINNDEMVKECIESPSLLQKADILESATDFNRKIIKINTSLLYKQQKYNLLQEESEGYSKLVQGILHQKISKASEIYELIGYFDLDPNRVADLIVQIGAASYDRAKDGNYYLTFLKKLDVSSKRLCNILGFVLSSDSFDSDGCFDFVSILLRSGLVRLEDLYPYLEPDDASFQAFGSKAKLGDGAGVSTSKMSLPSKLGSLDDMDNNDMIIVESDNKDDKAVVKAKGRDGIINSKALLFSALLRNGLLHEALSVFKRLQWPMESLLNSMNMTFFSNCLETCIEPLYAEVRIRKNSMTETEINQQGDNPLVCNSIDDFYSKVCPVLLKFGKFGFTVKLLSKLIRIGCKHVKEREDLWFELVRHVLTKNQETNVGYIIMLQKMFEEFPSKDIKYKIYSCLDNETKRGAVIETRRILRRITKDNYKEFGRALSKLCHENPFSCFNTILDQIEAYDNLIHPMVDCLRYLTPFEYDLMLWLTTSRISSSSKPRLKEDGTNYSQWLSNLSQFIVQLYKKYSPTLKIDFLLEYVYYNGLSRSGDFVDSLVILTDLVKSMTGIEQLLDGLSDNYLEGLSGGRLLRQETINSTNNGAFGKNSMKLLASINEIGLVTKLGIFLYELREKTLFNDTYSDINPKIVSSNYDNFHSAFVLYKNFITYCVNINDQLHSKFDKDDDIYYALLNREMLNVTDEVRNISGGSMKDEDMLMDLFWLLDYSLVSVPVGRYNYEIEKLKISCRQVETSLAQKAEFYPSSNEVKRLAKEKEKLELLISKLEVELRNRTESVEKNLQHLQETLVTVDFDTIDWELFVKKCLYPRIKISPLDAMFSAKFLSIVKGSCKKGDMVILKMVQLLSDYNYTFTSSLSLSESNNYGRLFAGLLKELDARKDPDDYSSYHIYSQLTESFKKLLLSEDDLKIRNAIVVLDKLTTNFPLFKDFGMTLIKTMDTVYDHLIKEGKDDLKVMANRYKGQLSVSESSLLSSIYQKPNFVDVSVTANQEDDKSVLSEYEEGMIDIPSANGTKNDSDTKEKAQESKRPDVKKEDIQSSRKPDQARKDPVAVGNNDKKQTPYRTDDNYRYRKDNLPDRKGFEKGKPYDSERRPSPRFGGAYNDAASRSPRIPSDNRNSRDLVNKVPREALKDNRDDNYYRATPSSSKPADRNDQERDYKGSSSAETSQKRPHDRTDGRNADLNRNQYVEAWVDNSGNSKKRAKVESSASPKKPNVSYDEPRYVERRDNRGSSDYNKSKETFQISRSSGAKQGQDDEARAEKKFEFRQGRYRRVIPSAMDALNNIQRSNYDNRPRGSNPENSRETKKYDNRRR